MSTAAGGMRSESRGILQKKTNIGGREAATETGTENTRTEGGTPARGLEFEATSERGMLRTSASSKQRGSFITREDESIGSITRRAVVVVLLLLLVSRTPNWGNLITNPKKKLL